ncbi:MAG: hypothetical protein KJ597_05905, partial [Nanoarchaeota archaeon]|nr:hypothetical protein [Nanoarchaeota archaeon]
MNFSYTALSSDNQKLTGVLDSGSLEAAKEELHKMGVSIISINEISAEEFEKLKTEEDVKRVESGVQTFMFEAIDPNGKAINGTIDAKDDYLAYRRLITEYNFKVNALYPPTATDAEKEASKQKIEEWYGRLKEEGYEEKVTKGELESRGGEIDKEIVKEIDQFIINSKKVLEEHQENFSSEFLRQIEKTLGELERIRTSNNLKHISEVCNQLYELISHPDQLAEGQEIKDTVYQGIIKQMEGSAIIRKEFDVYAKAVGLQKIQGLFNRIIKKLRGITGKKVTPKIPGEIKPPKKGVSEWLGKIVKGKNEEKVPTGPGFVDIIKKLFSYFSAPNAVLRQTRKTELSKAWNDWRGKKPVGAPMGAPIGEEPIKMRPEAEEKVAATPKKLDFTSFFAELDSFVGWLLFFYIAFLFLVNFSLEKAVGLPYDFVIKTLKSPLILNITILLLCAHLLFKLKNEYFRRNFVGSLFLLFFGFGLYFLL